jgi:ribose transport system substrate-binding protein
VSLEAWRGRHHLRPPSTASERAPCALTVDVLTGSDTAKQITGVKNAITLGANGLIFSPFDSSAAGTVLKAADGAKVAVVAADVAPSSGPVAIVVRANNVAYGELGVERPKRSTPCAFASLTRYLL